MGEPSSSPASIPAVGEGRRLGFVVADFHREIADAMLEDARERAEELGFVPDPVVRVSGTYDAPLPAQRLLRRDDVAGVVVVGVIVTGETRHDELIGHAAAHALTQVSLREEKPVGFAVTGPGQTLDQAEARVDRGAYAVDAVARVLHGLADI